MGYFKTFVSKVNTFAQSVGEDVKALNSWKNELIKDTVNSTQKVWSSSKVKNELADKVDKVAGKSLSDNNYTNSEKSKLAGLESSKWLGSYVGVAALESAHPTANPGNYADVDGGAGKDVIRYIWDDSDDKWVAGGSGTPLTAAQIKQMYESNADTNSFSDALKSKLSNIEAGAEKNAVKSVNGKTGAVTVTKSDVGLGNVENYPIASKTEAESGTKNTVYMTPLRSKEQIDKMTGDVNPMATYTSAKS